MQKTLLDLPDQGPRSFRWQRTGNLVYTIMKITAAQMLLIVLTVSISIAGDGFSQEILNRKVSVELTSGTLKEALKALETQAKVKFVYSASTLELSETVSLSVEGEELGDVLHRLLDPLEITYVVKGKLHIVLKPARQKDDMSFDESLLYRISNDVYVLQVTGTVTDENGNPLPGVNVIEKGTTSGTVTDIDGKYDLAVTDENAVLVFTFIGYQPREEAVSGRSVINVSLVPDVKSLEEIVIVGYGEQKKTNLTGAVDVISNKQIQNRQSPTVSQLLQGQSPGLSFSLDNYGFQPGAEMQIDIRGIGSLNGGGPLVIIDGIPGDMNRLNPEDIESISVLKDAAASAIYGARAPYGVILITTKSGGTDGRISVTYSGSVTNAAPQRLPDMPDSYTYARIMNEAGVNGGGRVHTNEVVDRIIAFQKGDIEYLKQFTVPDATHFETVPLPNGTWGFNQNGNANYDWFDENYSHSVNHKHNLSVQGGAGSTTFYFSAGYYDQGGVLRYGTDTYDRVNVMGKVKTAIAKWWDFSYQPRFMKSKRVLPNPQANSDYGIIFHQIARTRPNTPKYDGYGNLTVQSSKIPWLHSSGTNNYETIENTHNFSSVMRPIKGLELNADFAYRSVDFFGSERHLTVYEYLVDKTANPDPQTVPNSINQMHGSGSYWNTNLYGTYRFDIKERHNFALLAGYQAELNSQRDLQVMKNNLLVQDVLSLQVATGDPTVLEILGHWATQGIFSRLTYNFDEKYLFEANVRRDGTSKFQEGNRWGTFPSLSAGWNLHREAFWQPLENIVNAMKIRGSWGKLGNQNVLPYQDLNLIPLVSTPLSWIFAPGQGRPIGYTATPAITSRSLTWETVTTTNFGVEMSFLGSRLQTSFDMFERVTTDMIGPAEAQPGVLGAQLPQENNATLETKGWELSARWQHNINSRLSYFVNATLYDSRTFVTQYLNPTGTLSTWYNGKEYGEIWGYTAHDLYRTQEEVEAHTQSVNLSRIWGGAWRPGDVRYEDLNGDGRVDNGANTLSDHGDLRIIGNATPRFHFGISMGVNYRGFDLSMLWQGVLKRDLFFGPNENIFWGFGPNATQSSPFMNHLDYFRDQEGDKYTGLYEGERNINLDAYYPRPYLNGEHAKNKQASSLFLQNGAYLRLQNVQLGYTLSRELSSRLRLSSVRVYVAGENLFTITDLPPGIDPMAIESDWGIGKTYGADRMVSGGLIVTY